MTQEHFDGIAKKYPKTLISPNNEWEVKTECQIGWGGYYLRHYWKKIKDLEWLSNEKLFFIDDYADGDSHGYDKVKWKSSHEPILLFTPYSGYPDIILDDVEFDVTTDQFVKDMSDGEED